MACVGVQSSHGNYHRHGDGPLGDESEIGATGRCAAVAVTLSVCCLTADPGPRVAAVLADFREFAEEIVVAVDSRVDEARLGHHVGSADRVVRFEFAPPIERARPWLYAQCSGDWILEVDDDEVLSRAFLAQLRELTQDRRYLQYWLPCHWLFPDAAHWLDEPPWSFDSNRLVRNDPATLWAAGISHTRADPVFPSRYLERGFYHLAHLLTDERRRRRKVSHYLGIADEHRIASTDRDVGDFYLPDRVRGLRPAPVPSADRSAIAAVLGAAGSPLPTPSGREFALATRRDIDACWPERTLPNTAYEARVEILDPTVRLQPGEHRPVHVRVSNDGDETWPWTTDGTDWPRATEHRPAIRLSYRWYRADGAVRHGEEFRTGLPASLPPGVTTVVPVVVAAPDEPGDYLLEIDVLHELVRWFGGAARATVTVGRTQGFR